MYLCFDKNVRAFLFRCKAEGTTMEFQLIPFGLIKVLHTGNSYACFKRHDNMNRPMVWQKKSYITFVLKNMQYETLKINKMQIYEIYSRI